MRPHGQGGKRGREEEEKETREDPVTGEKNQIEDELAEKSRSAWEGDKQQEDRGLMAFWINEGRGERGMMVKYPVKWVEQACAVQGLLWPCCWHGNRETPAPLQRWINSFKDQ